MKDPHNRAGFRFFSRMVAGMLVVALIFAAPPGAWGAGHKIISGSAVLLDADSGEVLYQKNMHQKRYPASITKIMTGLLAVENCGRNDVLTASSAAVKIPRGYAHLALLSGDTIGFDDAMYALMLASANDAANVLAEQVAGTQDRFAAMMNERAQEIGAANTHFVNANGMPDNKHYTTAYDMALITREAIGQREFLRYFGASSHTLPSLNRQTKEVELKNYQFMLLEDADEYNPNVIGGKIGYTAEAGHTMSTVARRDGRTLICVVLGSTRDGKYDDTQALLDYGFAKLAGESWAV